MERPSRDEKKMIIKDIKLQHAEYTTIYVPFSVIFLLNLPLVY